jgi:hypothetical protein
MTEKEAKDLEEEIRKIIADLKKTRNPKRRKALLALLDFLSEFYVTEQLEE